MNETGRSILEMLRDGQITLEAAERLLDALIEKQLAEQWAAHNAKQAAAQSSNHADAQGATASVPVTAQTNNSSPSQNPFPGQDTREQPAADELPPVSGQRVCALAKRQCASDRPRSWAKTFSRRKTAPHLFQSSLTVTQRMSICYGNLTCKNITGNVTTDGNLTCDAITADAINVGGNFEGDAVAASTVMAGGDIVL